MKKQIALIIISLLAAMPAVAQNTNETYCNQNNTAENNFCFNGSQCFEEGRLMKAYVTGDSDAADGLKFIAGRMDKFYQKYFYL